MNCESWQRVSDLNLKKETLENRKMKHRMSRQGTDEEDIMCCEINKEVVGDVEWGS